MNILFTMLSIQKRKCEPQNIFIQKVQIVIDAKEDNKGSTARKNPYRHLTLNVNVHKTLKLTSTTLKKLELIVAWIVSKIVSF